MVWRGLVTSPGRIVTKARTTRGRGFNYAGPRHSVLRQFGIGLAQVRLSKNGLDKITCRFSKSQLGKAKEIFKYQGGRKRSTFPRAVLELGTVPPGQQASGGCRQMAP